MRVLLPTLVVTGLVAGSSLLAAPGAVAAVGGVTVCAKSLVKSAPVMVEIGYASSDIVEGGTHEVANNTCVDTRGTAPGVAWADASRNAKRIVVQSSSGRTVLANEDRADFPLAAGETVTVTYFFGK